MNFVVVCYLVTLDVGVLSSRCSFMVSVDICDLSCLESGSIAILRIQILTELVRICWFCYFGNTHMLYVNTPSVHI